MTTPVRMVNPEKLLEVAEQMVQTLIEMHISTAINLFTWPEAWALVHAICPEWTTGSEPARTAC